MKILFCTTDEICISFFDTLKKHLNSEISSIANMKQLEQEYENNKYDIVFLDHNLGLSMEIESYITEKNQNQKIVLANFPIEFLFTNCCRYKSMNNFRSISTLNNISKIVNIILNFENIECSDNKLILFQDYIETNSLYFTFDIDTKTLHVKSSYVGGSSYTAELLFFMNLLKTASIGYEQLSEGELRITEI